MTTRLNRLLMAAAGTLLMTGCHHAVPRAAIPPPPVSGPVMVSVPPPTHHDEPLSAEELANHIPVVQPVKPAKKLVKRPAPAVAVVAPATSSATLATNAAPAPSLGQLTTADDDTSVARDRAGQALRTQNERVAGLARSVLAAHASEVEQARRFLKAATDSWHASDYSATLALTTKAKVLLDDIVK